MATKILKIDTKKPEPENVLEAIKVLQAGGLVVFPTETVYGVACDASNPKAVKRLREVKNRSEDKPFSVMLGEKSLLQQYTSLRDARLFKLIDAYWPGPLTVIVPSGEKGQTLGIRIPAHIVALQIVHHSRRLLAVPSANFEGNPAPTTCDQAMRDLDGLVDLAVDGGKVDIGTASTIVSFADGEPKIVRQGAIADLDIHMTMNRKHILFVCSGNSCRSVMAEYLLKDRFSDRDDIFISSAGTIVVMPAPASFDVIELLKERDIDASGHASTAAEDNVLLKADLVFTMTSCHREEILKRAPSLEKRVYLLGEFQSAPVRDESELDIADPIGSGRAQYQKCMNQIEDCLNKVEQLL